MPRSNRNGRTTQTRVTEGEVPILEHPTYEPITEEDRKALNLWQKRALMLSELGSIPKRGYNAHHRYAYALEADVTAYLGPLMTKYMVVFDFSVDSVERIELYKTSSGSMMWLTRVTMNCALINADDPDQEIEFTWFGEGSDTGDKGLYKAYTGLLKFLYMKMFMIATGDDPEAFERTDALAETGGRAGVEAIGETAGADVRQVTGRQQPQRGGRQDETTTVQIKNLGNLSVGLDMGPRGTAEVIDQTLKTNLTDTLAAIDDEDGQRTALIAFLKGRPGTETGKVIAAMTALATQKTALAGPEAEAMDEADEEAAATSPGYGG